jgi:hypothetical protein
MFANQVTLTVGLRGEGHGALGAFERLLAWKRTIFVLVLLSLSN